MNGNLTAKVRHRVLIGAWRRSARVGSGVVACCASECEEARLRGRLEQGCARTRRSTGATLPAPPVEAAVLKPRACRDAAADSSRLGSASSSCGAAFRGSFVAHRPKCEPARSQSAQLRGHDHLAQAEVLLDPVDSFSPGRRVTGAGRSVELRGAKKGHRVPQDRNSPPSNQGLNLTRKSVAGPIVFGKRAGRAG